jgi:CubicO group peptidase (beta-lactamase class C family)
MLRLAFPSALVSLALSVSIVTAAPPSKETDKRAVQLWNTYLSSHIANGDFYGIILVTRDGKTLYDKSYASSDLIKRGTSGWAVNTTQSTDVPSGTQFLIASVTKTFTAAGIALLENDGKINATDSLVAWLPDFKYAKDIKVWQLLAHQSGLENPDYDSIAGRAVKPDELLDMIAARPLLFEPGKESRYSNAGYITLARIIEKASGMTYGHFLQSRIFDPLKMVQSGNLESGEVVTKLAVGNLPGVGTELVKPAKRDPSGYFGSGSIYSGAADLDRWLTAIDRHELFDITKQEYPFGWGKRKWFDRDVLVQSGIEDGYCSVVLTVPAEAPHIIVLMNAQTGFTNGEGKELLGVLYGEKLVMPARRPAVPRLDPETLELLAGTYLWGEPRIPMHLERNGRTLLLRWADSSSGVLLTPLSSTEFYDRTSFSTIRFGNDELTWTQNGSDTRAPRERP